jgi:hypothetical protein
MHKPNSAWLIRTQKNFINLLSWVLVRTGVKSEKHRVDDKVQIWIKAWGSGAYTQQPWNWNICQYIQEMQQGPGEGKLLIAGFNLFQLCL